jgi:hypothetical protein
MNERQFSGVFIDAVSTNYVAQRKPGNESSQQWKYVEIWNLREKAK